MLLLQGEELRDLLTPAEVVATVEASYRQWAEGRAFNHPRQSFHPGTTRLRILAGAAPDFGAIGARLHCNYMSLVQGVDPASTTTGHKAASPPQVVILWDYESEGLLAIMLGKGHLLYSPTAISAVAARYLARPDAEVLGLIGTGRTARDFLRTFLAVRPLGRVQVYSRSGERRTRFADEMGSQLGVEVVPVSSAREAVAGADILITATNANQPTFSGEWLRPGMHVTQIVAGSPGEENVGLDARRREIDDETLRRADLIITNARKQAIYDEQVTLVDAVAKGILRWDDIQDLAEVITGRIPGRTTPDQITLFYHAGGQGVYDIAVAARLYERAVERGVGLQVPLT